MIVASASGSARYCMRANRIFKSSGVAVLAMFIRPLLVWLQTATAHGGYRGAVWSIFLVVVVRRLAAILIGDVSPRRNRSGGLAGDGQVAPDQAGKKPSIERYRSPVS